MHTALLLAAAITLPAPGDTSPLQLRCQGDPRTGGVGAPFSYQPTSPGWGLRVENGRWSRGGSGANSELRVASVSRDRIVLRTHTRDKTETVNLDLKTGRFTATARTTMRDPQPSQHSEPTTSRNPRHRFGEAERGVCTVSGAA